MSKELRTLEHHQWLHAHVGYESRDCDGVISGGHTTWLAQLTEGYIDDEQGADIDFEGTLMRWAASFGDGVLDGPTQIECGTRPDNTRYINYHQETEEGFRAGEYVICRDRLCHESESQGPWQRDHTAEAAGY